MISLVCEQCKKGFFVNCCRSGLAKYCSQNCYNISRVGTKRSEKTKEKMIKNHADFSGKNHPNFGKHLSTKTKKKIGDGNRNKIVSRETKDKLRKANLGKHLSFETIEKLKRVQKILHKENPPFKGHFHSNNTKNKLREISIKNNSSKHFPSRVGTHHSYETRKRIGESHMGERNYNWKGGKTKVRDVIRDSFEYREWRQTVFERDNFTCVWCGQLRGNIEAHHKKQYSLIIEENKINTLEDALICEELWNVNNGITLCEKCHKKTNNYGVNLKRNFSSAQLLNRVASLQKGA